MFCQSVDVMFPKSNSVEMTPPVRTSSRWPDQHGPFELWITWEVFDGRLAPAAIELRPLAKYLRDFRRATGPDPRRRPLRASDLSIPLRKVAESQRSVAARLADVWGTPIPRLGNVDGRVAAWQASASGARGPRPDFDLLQQVAGVYLSATASGLVSPTEAVAQEVFGGERTIPNLPTSNTSYHAAGKAIHRARKYGLLDPARRGTNSLGWTQSSRSEN
jgi:hypothetical protein